MLSVFLTGMCRTVIPCHDLVDRVRHPDRERPRGYNVLG
jgi:hypothetical protein